jgi:hypothetical protein
MRVVTTIISPVPLNSGRNGSFGVFKLIEQDVIGFENFLQTHKDKSTRNCWPRSSWATGETARPWRAETGIVQREL